tara:strand:+ start:418 stop:648 length:231 start_codon:yes stop_codon:yes gene_type:complete
MKVGDLVRWKAMVGRKRPTTVGLVKRMFEHKLWRTDERGKKVDWNKVPKESFAEVVFGDQVRRLPITDLEVISEDP